MDTATLLQNLQDCHDLLKSGNINDLSLYQANNLATIEQAIEFISHASTPPATVTAPPKTKAALYWRNDALRAAASMARRYGQEYLAADIEGLLTAEPVAPPATVTEVAESLAALNAAQACMECSGYWTNAAGHQTDAALWVEKAIRALKTVKP